MVSDCRLSRGCRVLAVVLKNGFNQMSSELTVSFVFILRIKIEQIRRAEDWRASEL